MELDGFLVYYTAGDGNDIKHKVFIDATEASEYAINLANEMAGQNFTAFSQMMEWFNRPIDSMPSDPGTIQFFEIKIQGKKEN